MVLQSPNFEMHFRSFFTSFQTYFIRFFQHFSHSRLNIYEAFQRVIDDNTCLLLFELPC